MTFLTSNSSKILGDIIRVFRYGYSTTTSRRYVSVLSVQKGLVWNRSNFRETKATTLFPHNKITNIPVLGLIDSKNLFTTPLNQDKLDPSKSPGVSDQAKSEEKELLSEKDAVQDETVITEENPSIFKRFKDAYKQYGKVLIGVHVTTSVVWYGSFYYAAKSGIDVVPLLKSLGAGDTIIKPFQSSGAGNFAVAYLLYKIATPARYAVTIAGTQLTVKSLQKMGYMETPAPEDSITNLMKDSRMQMRDKFDDMKDNVDDMTDKFKDKFGDMKDNFDDKTDKLKGNLKGKMGDYKGKLQQKR